MKKLVIALLFTVGILGVAEARSHSYGYGNQTYGTGSNTQSEHVDGYTKQNGTYVAPYERTKANETVDDNYSTRGNYNPWTGKTGTEKTEADRKADPYNFGNR